MGKLRETCISVKNDMRSLDVRMVVVPVIAVVLLTVRHFVFNGSFFRAHVGPHIIPRGRPGGMYFMFPDLWWAVGCILLYLVVAALVARFAFGMRLADCGVRLKGVLKTLPIFFILYLLMLPLVIFVSGDPSFRNQYPFPKPYGGEWTIGQFALWETAYGVQFFALEFFMRGFFLFALWDKLGYNAIFVMIVPYTMIHYGKPAPEAFGAIIAGFALGYLALKTRSMIGCFLLHFGVAFTMDAVNMITYHKFITN